MYKEEKEKIDSLMALHDFSRILLLRAELREKKEYWWSDYIRKELLKLGVEVSDTKDGQEVKHLTPAKKYIQNYNEEFPNYYISSDYKKVYLPER